MTIENQNFTIYTGNNANLEALITEEDLVTPKNLTDATITWVLYDDDTDVILVTKTNTDPTEINVTDAINGLCTISLVPEDTDEFSPTKAYSHQCIVEDFNGDITTVFSGTVIVKRSMI